MRYKTVKDVIEFASELRPKDTADNQLCVYLEFYDGDDLVCTLIRKMYSGYTTITLNNKSLLDYFVTDFKIEIRDYCVAFVLSIKKQSSI